MARNEEKAHSMLNRFLTLKEQESRQPKKTRPFLASQCTNLVEAEQWRQQILREISRKVTEIQNDSLPENKIRDLNDEINKLLREKGHWEDRILELGGIDHKKSAPRITDADGSEVLGTKGYKYFGAARNLPGVKELFHKEPPRKMAKKRFELYRNIDCSYYGFGDDDEERDLVEEEAQAEKKARLAMVEEWEEEERLRGHGIKHEADELGWLSLDFRAHVPLPSQKDIEAKLVEKKKKELLAKYQSMLETS